MTKKQSRIALKKISFLAKTRFHLIHTEIYENIHSECVVFCQRHNETHVTTFRRYKNTKWGCYCCAQASRKSPRSPDVCAKKISNSLKNKPKKYKSWLLGKTGSSHPAYKHGKGNARADKQELLLLNLWKKQVFHFYDYRCFLTHATHTKETPLVCHHLESWDSNAKLRFDPKNGVVIQKQLHKQFHRKYGFGQNTTKQFENFCQEFFHTNIFPWTQGNQEPIFIVTEHLQQTFTFKESQERNLNDLAAKRNHKVIQNKYEHAHSECVVFCQRHNETYETTYHNYKKATFGMRCCAKEKQSLTASQSNRQRKKR